MDDKNKRLARNQGKVEFLANLNEIQSLFEQGYNKRNIHEKLLAKGHITMSYYTFCDNFKSCNTQKSADNHAHSPAKPPASKPLPAYGPRIVNTAKEAFPDPRKMNVEDGI